MIQYARTAIRRMMAAVSLVAVVSLFLQQEQCLVQSLSTIASSVQSTILSNQIVRNAGVPGLQHGMDFVKVGDSDLVVSKVCLGSMTWGQQNTKREGVSQLEHAFNQYGINFIDTAEMYPVPTKAETQGTTDETIAAFLKNHNRQNIVVATKVAGRSDRISWLPRRKKGTLPSLTAEQIQDSVDASLKRLGTDYIDLLQLHWPDRYTGGLFGSPDFQPTKYEQSPTPVGFEETLRGLKAVIDAGKVRYIGISNETPYGLCSMVNLAQNFPDLYPKIVSIQNSYSLVVRKDFEGGLAEACYHHKVGLLAYSPLAGGTLSGKYRDRENVSQNARMMLFPGFMTRYLDSLNEKAVNAYCDIAKQAGLTPAQLALSWNFHNPLVTSTIIGATSLQQLDEDIQAYDIRLSDDILQKVGKTYSEFPDPTNTRS